MTTRCQDCGELITLDGDEWVSEEDGERVCWVGLGNHRPEEG